MHPHIPARDIWWVAAGSAGYGARYVRLRVRVARSARVRVPDSTGAHAQTRRALRLVASHHAALYNFAGLRRFKAKFVPTWWESEYVLAPPGATTAPRVAYALTRAVVPGGGVRLVARQLARGRARRRANV